jgi:hypothetical protein
MSQDHMLSRQWSWHRDPVRQQPLVRFFHVTWPEEQAFPVVHCRSPASDWTDQLLRARRKGPCGRLHHDYPRILGMRSRVCWRLGHVFTALLDCGVWKQVLRELTDFTET